MGALNPATLSLIIQGIVAALNAAPKAIEVINAAKAYISSLFTAGLISAEAQKLLHDYVDAHAALLASGVVIPSSAWAVEPDPA
jgi:hypothetical protein